MELSNFIRLYAGKLSQVASLMVISGVIFAFLFMIAFFIFRAWLRNVSQIFYDVDGKKRQTCAFFHPYCNAGGGGERVLWVAIRAIQRRFPHVQCVVYTGDVDVTPDEIITRAHQRFNITIPGRVEFIYLKNRGAVEAAKYPYFTLLGQSVGSIFLGLEALCSLVPDIYIDTMGYALTLPLFKYLGGCPVACYVHYPTISTDMLSLVSQRVEAHNNASFISKSSFFSGIKLIYYKIFAYLYGMAGKRSNAIMVNSTWTLNHIVSLWQVPSRTSIVYPPCDVSEFVTIPIVSDKNKPKQIVSLGQFRPEKNHELQIRSFHKFLSELEEPERVQYKLVLAGSCRHEEDEARVETLRRLAEELNIGRQVDFRLNIPFSELKQLLAESMIGLHTMWNEHFGICVVEGMAAGAVMIAHDSGGPQLDIVVKHHGKPTGFLASDVDSYSRAFKEIFSMTPVERLDLRLNARDSLSRFSEQEFEAAFLAICGPLFDSLVTETQG